MKKIIRVIAALLAALLVCAIPLSGMAAGSAHVVHSDWNNKTRTKIITVEFTSASKNAKDFKIVGEPLSTEPIACMVRKNDPAFLKAVNDSIARQVKDGTLAKLWDKWFIQPIPPANVAVGLPLSEATKNAWNNPNNKPKEDYNK